MDGKNVEELVSGVDQQFHVLTYIFFSVGNCCHQNYMCAKKSRKHIVNRRVTCKSWKKKSRECVVNNMFNTTAH